MTTSGSRYAAVLSAACVVGVLAGWSPIGRQFDLWGYDLLLRLNPPPAEPSRSLILAIDEESLNAYGGVTSIREPLAEGLEILARHEPAAVAVDLVFSERRDPAQNQRLADALGSVSRVVLAANIRSSGDGWERPLPEFVAHASALGHVHAEPDLDGVCRRILLAKATGGERYWAMALETLRLAGGAAYVQESEDALEVGDQLIPASRRLDRELLIRFPNPASPIERISLRQVLADPDAAAVARGRTVFVGVLVLGGIDRYLMTPYSDGLPATGVEINAAAYETLARGDFLTPVSTSAVLALALTLAAGIAWSFWRMRRGAAALLALPGAVLALACALPAVAFAAGHAMPVAQMIFAPATCFGVGAGYYFLVLRGRLDRAEQQRKRYQRAVHYVTHEMRTPLTAIQGSSELISRYDLPDQQRREIGDLIHRESQRLAKMVDTFLSVERLSAGELKLRREPVDPAELIAACVRRVEPAAERKRSTVRAEVETPRAILGDREFLEYACYNLLTNAVKYSPAETAITVRALAEGDRVLVSVEDQGYGMDEKDLANIFKKFYRASTAAQSGEKGSGLGLAIVEEIVVQHGGSIRVESEVGRGTRFSLSLPAAEVAADQGVQP